MEWLELEELKRACIERGISLPRWLADQDGNQDVSLSKRLAPQASGWPTRLPADTWAISRLLTQQPSPQVSYLSTQALQVPAPCTDSSRRALP